MVDETLIPVVQARERGREAQGGADELLADAQLEVQGQAFKVLVVGLDLSAQILDHGRERPAPVFVEVVGSEVKGHGR